MYDKGLGVARDYVQAHKWYNLAVAADPAGFSWEESRDMAAENLDTQQINKAQRLAREWTPDQPCP